MGKFISNPKTLFLIDGVGALISAFLLGVVLVKLEYVFGIPSKSLYFLAVIPIFFAAYDIYCYRKDHKLAFFLKGIAIVNVVYCVISFGLAIYHIDTITLFGWFYVLIEILIIIALSIVEIRVANKIKS